MSKKKDAEPPVERKYGHVVMPVALKNMEEFAGNTPSDGWDVAIPEGFVFGKHKPIAKMEFASPETYYLHKAAESQYQHDVYMRRAEEAKLGKGDKRLSKLLAASRRFQSIKDELLSEGKTEEEIKAILNV